VFSADLHLIHDGRTRTSSTAECHRAWPETPIGVWNATICRVINTISMCVCGKTSRSESVVPAQALACI